MKFEKSADGYQQRDRYYKAMRRRQQTLLDVTRSEPLIPLEHPYVQGKVRRFVLSERLAAQPEAEELAQALIYFERRQYSRRGDFTYRKGKSRKLIPMDMPLHRMSVYSVLRGKVPEKLLRYFVDIAGRPVVTYARLHELLRNGYPHKLEFRYQAELVVYVEDYWITHQRAINPEVDSELEVIDQFVEQNQLGPNFYGYSGMLYQRCLKMLQRRELRSLDRERVKEGVDEFHYYLQSQLTVSNKKGGDDSSPFSLPKIAVVVLHVLLCIDIKKRLPLLRAA